jgi:hypothetical protein
VLHGSQFIRLDAQIGSESDVSFRPWQDIQGCMVAARIASTGAALRIFLITVKAPSNDFSELRTLFLPQEIRFSKGE